MLVRLKIALHGEFGRIVEPVSCLYSSFYKNTALAEIIQVDLFQNIPRPGLRCAGVHAATN